jgi:hypothetical protein
MEIETIIKVIGAIVAISSAGKIIYDITTGKKSRLREDYKFAKEFLEEIKNNPGLHPFAIEKGYHAIAGSTNLSSEEVAYLLSLKNPGKCLSDYALSKKYLQTINTDGDFYLVFARKHSSSRIRLIKKSFYLFFYAIFAIIAISPIFAPSKYAVIGIITLPGFGYYALLSLNSFIKIERGEKLVKNQQRHTQKILLPVRNTSSIKQ